MFSFNSKGGIDKQQLQLAPIPTTTLADGEFITFRINIPLGFTLKIWAVGVQNDANSAPAGLTAEVDDETNAVNLVSENSKRVTGNPLAEKSGDIDVAFTVENDTGNPQNASGVFAFTVE